MLSTHYSLCYDKSCTGRVTNRSNSVNKVSILFYLLKISDNLRLLGYYMYHLRPCLHGGRKLAPISVRPKCCFTGFK